MQQYAMFMTKIIFKLFQVNNPNATFFSIKDSPQLWFKPSVFQGPCIYKKGWLCNMDTGRHNACNINATWQTCGWLLGLTQSSSRNCSLSLPITSPLPCATCCLISSLIGPWTSTVNQLLVTPSLYIHASTCLYHSSWPFWPLKMRPLCQSSQNDAN
jgi:hypothetical protein